MPSVFSVVTLSFIGVLGALIGSFANVVIYRLPKKESIVFPGSQCPNCGHKIKPWENVPVLSWLFLRGRCSGCRQGISARYPLVETLMALGFVLLAWRWPLELHGFTVLPLLAVFAMLVMLALIDLDHFILPDSLTLPAVVVALLGAFVYSFGSGLPTAAEAVTGGALGAGILALINRVGSLVLRRFGDTAERLWPVGMDQVNVAALGGALLGWPWGVGAALVSVGVNLVARRPVRLPEGAVYALWAVALALSSLNPWVTPVTSLAGTFAAAGVAAVLGALFWWLRDIAAGPSEYAPETLPEDDEPIAMGFGDVKLAAVLGALLGWQNLLVGLFAAFVIGAVSGVIGRLAGGGRVVPFGPSLILGGLLALFFGADVIGWYLGLLGV
ncbi:A24 family peptidase [soil metagenome]